MIYTRHKMTEDQMDAAIHLVYMLIRTNVVKGVTYLDSTRGLCDIRHHIHWRPAGVHYSDCFHEMMQRIID